MTDQPLDLELQAKLRELSEARIRAQVQAAKRQADQRRQTRTEFARNRDRGLEQRHQIRERMIHRHQQGDQL